MYDVLIIGSGISGVSTALRLSDLGIKTCILDVGIEPRERHEIKENLYDYRLKNDSFELMIGKNFEGLHNLKSTNQTLPAKLVSPGMKFVTERAEELSPLLSRNFTAVQSFAKGGLANAWGAGLMRFNRRDLEGFPIKEEELAPYYERLIEEIGISGENDDLTPFFGEDKLLQKPLKLSANARIILKNYLKKRKRLNRKGVFIGRPRLAVLSEEKEGRKACEYHNLEFWQPHLPYIYHPSLTLDKLISSGKVIYKRGLLARAWFHREGKVVVEADYLLEKRKIYLECRKLVLAAGAISSAKLALTSRKDYRSKLPLLDNTALQFPFIIPQRIGKKLETDAFGLTQLNFVYEAKNQGLLQGSILEVTSPSRAEFFSSLPLAAADNLRLIKYLLPALIVMQLYLPSLQPASLRLNESGELEIEGEVINIQESVKREIIRIFRSLGAFSFPRFVVKVPNGLGIHYAGTLPMVSSPQSPYQCNKFGELHGEQDVYVVDGALFPRLPSKNFSFAVMANAMRIAEHIAKTL